MSILIAAAVGIEVVKVRVDISRMSVDGGVGLVFEPRDLHFLRSRPLSLLTGWEDGSGFGFWLCVFLSPFSFSFSFVH